MLIKIVPMYGWDVLVLIKTVPVLVKTAPLLVETVPILFAQAPILCLHLETSKIRIN